MNVTAHQQKEENEETKKGKREAEERKRENWQPILLCYIMYVIIFYVENAALHLARLVFLDYANPVNHADKRSCFWRNATIK